MNKLALYTLLLGALLFLGNSCSGDKQEVENNKPTKNNARKKRTKNVSKITAPQQGAKFVIGDEVAIALAQVDSAQQIDSVRFFVDGTWLGTLDTPPYQLIWDSETTGTGKHTLITVTYKSDSTREGNNVDVELLSDVKPVPYRYQVVQRYPHDAKAFTQGLLYEDGFLFEGTGQKGMSSLRKIDLRNGDVLKMRQLEPEYFGEGIVIFEDEIFQLTWHAQKAFVYDKQTFELKRELKYPGEGWGLTTDGQYLIMSDGSEKIYFFEPKGFSEIKHIQVYDDKGPVSKLNELEYIEGELFANVWETDDIVRIDPKTGKVLGRINLSNLLDQRQVSNQVDVLNGIAYDTQRKRIFVTGKWWPYLFEIRLSEAQ